jgi:hypothetical protein
MSMNPHKQLLIRCKWCGLRKVDPFNNRHNWLCADCYYIDYLQLVDDHREQVKLHLERSE